MSKQRFRSIDHCHDYFRRWFGPTIAAHERVGPEGDRELSVSLGRSAAGAGERLHAPAAYPKINGCRVVVGANGPNL